MFRGHSQRVVDRRLTSAIDIQSVPRPLRDDCMSLFYERNRHSNVFRGHTQRVAYRRLTSVVAIQNVFRGHSLRVAYCLLRSAIDVQKFSEDIFVEKVRRI